MTKRQLKKDRGEMMRRGMFALIALLLACVLMAGAVSADTAGTTEPDKTQAELDKTQAELDKTQAELDKTQAELDKKKTEKPSDKKPSDKKTEKPSDKKTEAVKTPVPVLGGLLGILAAGVLLRRRE